MQIGSNPAERAPWVCENCKNRKRACDKRLPECGPCASRGYRCSYINGPSKNKIVLPHDQAGGSLTHSGGFILDADINNQVEKILQSLQLTAATAIERFFRDFYPYFPVVAPEPELTELGLTLNDVKASESVLILAMTLVSQHLLAEDSLYSVVRRLFWNVQESIDQDIALVQVVLLIAVFEYARGWADKAFVSIGIAIRLAQNLGLDEIQDSLVLIDGTEPALSSEVETSNLWCGIVLMDSVIQCETPNVGYVRTIASSMTRCPRPRYVDGKVMHGIKAVQMTQAENAQDELVIQFGLQVEAAYLLDRAMTVKHAEPETPKWMHRLRERDLELKDFLALMMSDTHQQKFMRNASVNIIVRALFLLHETALAEEALFPHITDNAEQSRKTLSSMTAIMTDAAHIGKQEHKFHHCLPLCCAANIKSAKRYAAAHKEEFTDTNFSVLAQLEESFCMRWRCGNQL